MKNQSRIPPGSNSPSGKASPAKGLTGKVRVAVVIPRYYPIFGGAETQCRLLNKYLLASGEVEIPFLATHYLEKTLTKVEYVDGICVHRIGRPGISRWASYGFLLSLFLFLWRRRRTFDIVHCHATGVCGLTVSLLGKLTRKIVVLKISSNGELLTGFAKRTGLKQMITARIKTVLAGITVKTAYIVALNEEGLTEAQQAGARNVVTIPNGVDSREYYPLPPDRRKLLRQAYGFGVYETVLLFVGRFTRSKGMEILLDAFQSLKKDAKLDNVHLCLAGSGTLQQEASDELLSERRKKDYDERIHVLEPKIPAVEYYQMADVFVFPSRREGLPNVVLEALACGLPCVLSDISPHLELAAKNPLADIRTFSSGSADELGCCIREALKDVMNRPQKTLPVHLENQFTMEDVSGKYVALYRHLTAGWGIQVRSKNNIADKKIC